VVMVVELLVDEDREFQTVGAAILKALDPYFLVQDSCISFLSM